MRYRAVIFDVYRTLLHVGAPPVDAALQWETLWRTTLPGTVPPAFDGFHFGCSTLIAREHAQAKDRGIRHPEIYWPSITTEAFPELKTLSAPGLDRFLFGHAQLQRTITLATGAADVLLRLNEARVLMGISSNAQPYTLHELR
ncbi:MAG TPA: hypothetical protein VK968_11135, partial [Roseimicrobium sp.]|nr:hypothetical protein [Roseimicrobium sp.]